MIARIQPTPLCGRIAAIPSKSEAHRLMICAALADAPDAQWFMDYRNADGSIAEMCGNGVRVFVRFLEHLGLADLTDGRALAIGTRAGVRRVRREGDQYAVEMGEWRLTGGPQALADGYDAQVRTTGLDGDWP